MIQCICIEKVVLTEYDRSIRVVDLKNSERLFIRKSSYRIIEDTLCEIFSNSKQVYIHARWESRECTMKEIIKFNEGLKENNHGIFR